jgi:protein SYS1
MPFWDPIILISQVYLYLLVQFPPTDAPQIVAIQSLHYLTLAICIPPAVSIFSSRRALNFYGGPANVNLIISWHELAGQSAINPEISIDGIYSGGAQLATSTTLNAFEVSDPGRRWVIAAMWLVASLVE